jgi:hypothetical protein
MSPARYVIDARHPNAQRHDLAGELVKVTTDRDGTRYVSSARLGCSKNYDVQTDEAAIRRLLAEHALTLTAIAQEP